MAENSPDVREQGGGEARGSRSLRPAPEGDRSHDFRDAGLLPARREERGQAEAVRRDLPQGSHARRDERRNQGHA